MEQPINPTLRITSFSSNMFRYSLILEISHLPPNEIFEVRDFGPDGEALSGHIGLKSDRAGNLVSQGRNIGFGHIWSKPIKKGDYIVGIMKGEFKHSRKLWFEEWNNSPNSKKYTTFKIDYSKECVLSLYVPDKVPWGTAVKVSGKLWYKDVEFPWCSGSTDMENLRITINGNDIPDSYGLTNAFSEFSNKIQIGTNLRAGFFAQAHYAGDDIYFEHCDSNIVNYEIIKHKSSLSLVIEPIIHKLEDLIENHQTERVLKAGQSYFLKGHLHDDILDNSICGKVIRIAGTEELHLSSAVTNEKGEFTLYFTIPDLLRSIVITADYDSDNLYFSSTAKIAFKVKQDLSSKLIHFKHFKAYNTFHDGFKNIVAEQQIASSMWLLSLLNTNPIPLGIFDKSRDGEKIVRNGNSLIHSADILAYFDNVPLIIDCTVSVPNSEKIDKIFNTATYLTEVTGHKTLPLIISNQPANNIKKDALNSKVLLLDRDDISNIMALVVIGQLDDARKTLLDKLKLII